MQNYIRKFESFEAKFETNINRLFNVYMNDTFMVGFSDISHAFNYIREQLLQRGLISDEESILFNDMVIDITSVISLTQEEIDQNLEELLDSFGVIINFEIIKKQGKEEEEKDKSDFDMEDELDYFLDYDDNILESKVFIMGKKNSKDVELEEFSTKKEAECYIGSFKEIYSDYDDVWINES